jgi:autotransporter adhesin
MADPTNTRRMRRSRLVARSVLSSSAFLTLIAVQHAQAQTPVVSACSGVSLPRSVVTGIVSPVVTGITGPTEATVNGILTTPLLGVLLPPLNTNATGLLDQAAAGDPITLQAIATDGTVVGPTDQCRVTADSVTLNTPGGVAIGGNQITGLGADGAPAFAGDINGVALGNNARVETGAAGSLAFGQNSQVTGVNSVALGAGSVADRGPLVGYGALGLAGPQNSAGEVSVGAPGALRQITNVAAGSSPTDAATVGQVAGVLSQVAAVGASSVQYDTATRDRVTLAGNGGTVIGNLGAGALAADSTEAVNGGQLFATNQAVAGNSAAIGNLDTRVTANEGQLAALSADVAGNSSAITNLNAAVANQPTRYADAGTPTVPNGGVVSDDATLAGLSGGPVGLHNVRAGAAVAGSTDAVNGDQLAATNAQVVTNTTAISSLNNLLVGSTVVPVQYSDPDTPTTPNGGERTNDVTLAGADAVAPVALHNVAAGTVTATSTDAVNGGQLYATNQVAEQAATLASNSVQYDPGATSVTFTNTGGRPTTLRNVAAGTSTTDAVNVGQLQSGVQSAVAQANGYTDARLSSALEAVNFDLRRVRRDMGAGTSAAMAAAALPQANEPGRTMVAVSGGTYRGQSAVAFGASTFLNDGHSILRLGATYDSRGYGGANAGFGYQF